MIKPEMNSDHGKGLSANFLKTIAIIAMLIDHVAVVFLPATAPLTIIMRGIGRITGPIMFYFIAEGYHKTRNINRYTLRLAIFAVITYIPFIYCFEGQLPNAANFLHFNVIYTLLLGLLAIRARREIKSPALQWLAICFLILCSLPADWSYIAMICILAFDYFYGDFQKQAFAYSLITLFQIAPIFTVPILSLFYKQYTIPAQFYTYLSQLGLFLPILLLRFYNHQKGKGAAFAKWGFYIFYPLHLLIIGLVRDYLLL